MSKMDCRTDRDIAFVPKHLPFQKRRGVGHVVDHAIKYLLLVNDLRWIKYIHEA